MPHRPDGRARCSIGRRVLIKNICPQVRTKAGSIGPNRRTQCRRRRLGRNVDYRGANACRRRHRPTRPRTDSTRGVRPSRWSSDVLTEITDEVVIMYENEPHPADVEDGSTGSRRDRSRHALGYAVDTGRSRSLVGPFPGGVADGSPISVPSRSSPSRNASRPP